MKIIFTLLLFFTSTLLFAQQTQSITITSGGIARDFFLYVPEIYDANTPAPLVFCLHGYGSSASANISYTGFRPVADTAGFILIHPQGTQDLFGTPHWNVGWGSSSVDDVAFVEDMIDYVNDNYNLNNDRIYSTGFSNGGFMSYLLACQLGDKIAAIASVTGSMSPSTFGSCSPNHPTPVLQIHGTDDGTVPYEGGPFAEGIDNVINYWVNYNNCSTTPSQTPIPDINAGDGSTVDHFVYSGGTNGATVELFKVYNGDHDWPGAFGNLDISSNIEIWKFFSRYDINGTTAAVDEQDVDLGFSVSPNPAQSDLMVSRGNNETEDFRILTMDGKEVLTGVLSGTADLIDLKGFESGTYLLISGHGSQKFIIE
jgi:polyhydroxybutyrate depolymerase